MFDGCPATGSTSLEKTSRLDGEEPVLGAVFARAGSSGSSGGSPSQACPSFPRGNGSPGLPGFVLEEFRNLDFCTKSPNLDNKFMLKQNKIKINSSVVQTKLICELAEARKWPTSSSAGRSVPFSCVPSRAGGSQSTCSSSG